MMSLYSKKINTLNNVDYKDISVYIYSSNYFYRLGESSNNRYFDIYIDNISYQAKDYINLKQDPYIRSIGILDGDIKDIDNLSYSFNSKIVNSLVLGKDQFNSSGKKYTFSDFKNTIQFNLEKLEIEYLANDVYNPEIDFLKNIVPYLIDNKERNKCLIKNSFKNYDEYEKILQSMGHYIKTEDSIDEIFITDCLEKISLTSLYKETKKINNLIKVNNKNVFSSKII